MLEKNFIIAIPAYNEADSLPIVLEDLLNLIPRNQVLVINDGSTDNTSNIAKKFLVKVIDMPFNVGVGGAMRVAFLFAKRNKIETVIQFDADGQHDKKYITTLLEASSKSEIVIGSRFAGEGRYRIFGPRRWAMRLLAVTVSKITKTKLTDVSSGFRATSGSAVELFASHYPVEYLGDTVESIIIGHRARCQITEVPVSMNFRIAGRPSQSLIQATLFLARALLVIFLAIIRPAVKIEKGA